MPDKNDFTHNIVFIGNNGHFAKSKTTRASLDVVFAHLQQTNVQHIALYFHGGLVNEADGSATALRLAERFKGGPAHFISFVWETGFFEIIGRNVGDIASTTLFGELSEIITRKVSKYLIVPNGTGRGNVELSSADVKQRIDKPGEPLADVQVRARGNAANLREQEIDAIENEFVQELTYEIDPEHPVVVLLEAEATQSDQFNADSQITDSQAATGVKSRGLLMPIVVFRLAKAAAEVIRRYIRKTDHGPWPTIIEEILRQFFLGNLGKGVWNNIKAIAEKTMWDTGNESIGGYFLHKLHQYKQVNPHCRLDAVGHSAGSIAVCHLLRNAPDLKWQQLVFFAPACTHKLFYDEVVTYPERFGQFRMFTMADEFETADSLANGLYPASLLYLVSGTFEPDVDTPILGMERYLGNNLPYNADQSLELAGVRAFLEAQPDRVVLAESPIGAEAGFKTLATRHGDFDDDILTLDSLNTLLTTKL